MFQFGFPDSSYCSRCFVLSFGVHRTVSYSEKNDSVKCKALVQNGGNDRDIYQDNFMMLSVALQFLLIYEGNHSCFIFLL